MEKPWKVIAAFIGVFIAGAVFGGFFTLSSSVRRAPPQQRPLAQLPPSEQPRPKVAGPQVGPVASTAPKSTPITPVIMRGFTKELKLTPEQREKIQPIVARAGEDFQRLREEEARQRQQNIADVARVNERMYVDVAAILTPEQREKLQAMRQQREERLQAEKQKRAEELQKWLKEKAAAKQTAESSK